VKKIIVIVVIVVIIGIGVTASSISMEKTKEIGNFENDIILDEAIPVEDEPKKTGRALTVELTESIGLKSP